MKKLEAKNCKIGNPKITNITDLIESDPYYPFKGPMPRVITSFARNHENQWRTRKGSSKRFGMTENNVGMY